MKRVLSIILALTLVLAFGIPALAEDRSTELTATVGTSYVVTIPTTKVIVDGALSTPLGDISLSKANIPAGGKVTVSLTTPEGEVNTYKLMSGTNEIPFAVMSGAAAFASGDLTNLTDKISLTIDIAQAAWNAAPSGAYTGTVSFTVTYVEPIG